jgi:hypothetical protein
LALTFALDSPSSPSLLTFVVDEEVDDAIDEIARVCFTHHVSPTDLNLKMSTLPFRYVCLFTSTRTRPGLEWNAKWIFLFPLEVLLKVHKRKGDEKRLEELLEGNLIKKK